MTINDRAARETARWVIENPDIAEPVLAMAVYNQVQRDLAIHKAAFQETIDTWAYKTIAKMGPALRGELISKVRKGEDITGLEMAWQALQSIAKAGPPPQDSWELSARAKKQQRDSGGRFRTMGRKIEPAAGQIRGKDGQAVMDTRGLRVGKDDLGLADRARSKAEARANEANTPLSGMSDAQRRQFAAEYSQILSTIDEARGRGEVKNVILHTSDGKQIGDFLDEDGDLVRYPMAGAGDSSFNITGVEIDYDPDLAIGSSGADILGALGGAGAKSGGSAAANLYQEWNKEGTRSTASEPRKQAYNRISSAADVVDVMTPNKTPETKLALVAGKWAARHGQEIENAVGPTAEKAAYRYRAIEKQPNKELQGKLEALRGDRLRETVTVTGTDRGAGAKARYNFIMGAEGRDRPGGWEEAGLSSPWRGNAPVLSPVRDYLTDKLPDPKRVDLHRKSGRATPSQGIIIDSKGQITTESVGMGEDHYLPFTLSALKGIKGGEYARTRAWGGPTTEDFYTSMITGGRAFTVVSNHGTFHVEFDPAFKGSRRYSDKTARMIKTYAGYLDTLEGNEARMGMISGSRNKEIAEKARKTYPTSSDKREEYRRKLVDEELRAPKLSAQEKVKVLNDLLEEQALVNGMSSEEMRQSLIDQVALTRGANAAEIAVADWQEHPEKMAQEFGVRAKFDRAVQDEEDVKAKEIGKLRLDGTGYAQALYAMQEQFPYFISSVEYRPANENVQDEYYVRPGDTRPAGVSIGYQNAPNSARAGKTSAASLYGKQGGKQAEKKESKLIDARKTASSEREQKAQAEQQRQKIATEGLPEPERVPTEQEVITAKAKKAEKILTNGSGGEAWRKPWANLVAAEEAVQAAPAGPLRAAEGKKLQAQLDLWQPVLSQAVGDGVKEFSAFHAELSRVANEAQGLEGQMEYSSANALFALSSMGDPGEQKFYDAIGEFATRFKSEDKKKAAYLREGLAKAEYQVAAMDKREEVATFASDNAELLNFPEGGEFIDLGAADPVQSARNNAALMVGFAKDFNTRSETQGISAEVKKTQQDKRDAAIRMTYLLSQYVKISELADEAPDSMVIPSEELGRDLESEEDAAARIRASVNERQGGPADGALPAGFKLGG